MTGAATPIPHDLAVRLHDWMLNMQEWREAPVMGVALHGYEACELLAALVPHVMPPAGLVEEEPPQPGSALQEEP